MNTIYKYVAMALAAIAFICGVAIFFYHRGHEAGYQERDQQAQKFALVQSEAIIQNDKISDQVHDDTLKWINTNLGQIQGQTDASVKKIQVIYRDHPVSGCVRPDGVREELDKAVQSANNAAEGRLPAGEGGAAKANPGSG